MSPKADTAAGAPTESAIRTESASEARPPDTDAEDAERAQPAETSTASDLAAPVASADLTALDEAVRLAQAEVRALRAQISPHFMYNALTMSGGVSWWNPSTGEAISRPKVQIRVRPEDILTGDTLCPCEGCKEGD